jgi:predicted ATPase/class 3 adenylate cyclase
VIFDVLARGDERVMDLPYSERRRILKSLELQGTGWCTAEAFDDGASLFAAVVRQGFEGIVAKSLIRRSAWRTRVRAQDLIRMPELPSGTVTLLFTDIEGSTRLLDELGERYADVLAEHRRILREAFQRHGGVEVDTQGDAFFYAFAHADAAVAAAAAVQDQLAHGRARVRIGIHTGKPIATEEGYVGIDVHRAARIMSAGHGGQVVLSERSCALLDGDYELTDLGLHRLKDLGEPEKLYQLGDGEFPPLKTLDATNLPVAASPLLGRERELEEVLALLTSGTRLVTITGPGGTGKTRLALQVGAELVGSVSDGVFWVPLAALNDPELVLPTIAQTLGARDELAEHLRGKELLILLDNLEHLLPAARALAELLASSPKLRLLVTSRAPLHLLGECEYPLEPLPDDDAVMLFLERARGVGRELEPDKTVAAICRRLDGLPLAIELAAARTKLLPPETLLQRLDHALPLLTAGARDAPERQRTLRATIEWSYELLGDDAKRLFARLAVFAGSFSLEAVEEVCDADLDALAELVDLGLLKPISTGRFLMLETIKEYAVEGLEESGRAEHLRRRHVEHFVRLAEAAEPELRGSEAEFWLDRLEAEHDNMRAAIAWAVKRGSGGFDVRLAGALARFWWIRSYLDEGKQWLQVAVARPGEQPPDARARAFRGLGYLAWARGEREEAVRCHEEALALYRHIGDSVGTGMSLTNLGIFWREEGDLQRARPLLEEGAGLLRESGDMSALAHSLGQLGVLALEDGDLARAAELCEEGLALARKVGNEQTAALLLQDLGFIALHGGRLPEAATRYAESLEIARRFDLKGSVASCLKGIAAAAAASGDRDRAARILGAANTVDEQVHGTLEAPEVPEDAWIHAFARGHLGDERSLEAWSDGRAMTLEEAAEYALRTD